MLNSADTSIFQPWTDTPLLWEPGGELVLVSHGLIVERYGLDTIVRAVALLTADVPGIRLRVLGSGEYLPDLQSLVRELAVEDHVWLAGFVPQAEMLEAISTAHIGVVAVKRDAFRDLTHTNKMYECVAMRKPVVIAETSAVRAYFDGSCFQYFVSDDPADLARSILDLYRHPERVLPMVERASQRYQQYAWGVQKDIYLQAVLGGITEMSPSLAGTGAGSMTSRPTFQRPRTSWQPMPSDFLHGACPGGCFLGAVGDGGLAVCWSYGSALRERTGTATGHAIAV